MHQLSQECVCVRACAMCTNGAYIGPSMNM